MGTYTIQAKVDEANEFIEIANDFSNVLDLLREAISNSYDADADKIWISFSTVKEYGESILRIEIRDNGTGMDRDGLQAFFDLGNSLRRGDASKIGEKGHGTKVFFNSSEIQVVTCRDGTTLRARLADPYKRLHDRQGLLVDVSEEATPGDCPGTTVLVKGYNNNRRELFTHERLKDYVLWFTKVGSVEAQLGDTSNSEKVLYLQGLDRAEDEEIPFGHPFPEESSSLDALLDEHMADAPKYYCKRIVKSGQLKKHPEIRFDAIFSIEGNRVKQIANPMIRRQGLPPPEGSYKVQDRYGLWLCRDLIPVQRQNDWIGTKGSEFLRFHAFFNCQEFRLTANRGSVNNTPTELLQDIEEEVRRIYDQISSSHEWNDMEWLESQAEAYKGSKREKQDLLQRLARFNKADVATYKGANLVEPYHESGVESLLTQLLMLEPELLPFQILDYNTHVGFDVLVKGSHTTPIYQSTIFYVEFKHSLTSELNHSFENLHSIICWDTTVKNQGVVTDPSGEERALAIVPPDKEKPYTRYFLDRPGSAHKIEVFVLKYYLREKLGIVFRPRTEQEMMKI